jgi:hypothetical protein
MGLNLTVMSYLDNVDFGIVCDRDQMDDAWPLMHAFAAALEEMCDVICGARRPPARRFAPDEGAPPRQDSPTGAPG